MRYGVLMLLAMAAVLAGCSANRATPAACAALPSGKPRPVVVAGRQKITLDGDLRDWEGKARFYQVNRRNGFTDPSTAPLLADEDLSFRFATCYDEDALYVAVEVKDDSIQSDSCLIGSISCPAWDDDAVEVFIDANHNHASNSRVAGGAELVYGGEFALVANGAANSDFSGYPRTFGRPQGWQGIASQVFLESGETFIRYEMRLSWKVLGGVIKPGSTIGFNISAQDDDDGGRRDHALYFSGIGPGPFLDERGFADLYLEP